ncbi:MAG TPA: hypothetical protein VGE13_03260 [Candidatus Saccharimonadales bacterium]
MNEDESLKPTNIPVEPPSPSHVSPYELLLRQSRKMGSFATRTYDITKEFLKTDVTQLRPDAALFKYRQRGGKQTENDESINAIVKYSHQVLASARTVLLPWSPFPDSVIVDRSKVTIIKQTFFWSSETITIRIEDILNVTSTLGPLFGSITISSRVMNSTDHFEIDSFWRKDAIYLKQIIQGYMIALHSKVDTSRLSKDELVHTLLQLGRDSKA